MPFHLQNKDGSINWNRVVCLSILVLITLALAGYSIFRLYNAHEYRKRNVPEPSTKPVQSLQRVLTS